MWCGGGSCQRKHLSWLIMNTLPSLWEATKKTSQFQVKLSRTKCFDSYWSNHQALKTLVIFWIYWIFFISWWFFLLRLRHYPITAPLRGSHRRAKSRAGLKGWKLVGVPRAPRLLVFDAFLWENLLHNALSALITSCTVSQKYPGFFCSPSSCHEYWVELSWIKR